MINWAVRAKNKLFWVALIPAVLILAQAVLQIVGIDFDYTELSTRLVGIVEALFTVLVILGVVADPTTEGVADSEQAMTYTEPKGHSVEIIKKEGTDFDE